MVGLAVLAWALALAWLLTKLLRQLFCHAAGSFLQLLNSLTLRTKCSLLIALVQAVDCITHSALGSAQAAWNIAIFP